MTIVIVKIAKQNKKNLQRLKIEIINFKENEHINNTWNNRAECSVILYDKDRDKPCKKSTQIKNTSSGYVIQPNTP